MSAHTKKQICILIQIRNSNSFEYSIGVFRVTENKYYVKKHRGYYFWELKWRVVTWLEAISVEFAIERTQIFDTGLYGVTYHKYIVH